MKIYRIKDPIGIYEIKLNEILSSSKNFTSCEIKSKLKHNSVRIELMNDLLLSNLIFKQLRKTNNLNTSNFMLLLNTFNLSQIGQKRGI